MNKEQIVNDIYSSYGSDSGVLLGIKERDVVKAIVEFTLNRCNSQQESTVGQQVGDWQGLAFELAQAVKILIGDIKSKPNDTRYLKSTKVGANALLKYDEFRLNITSPATVVDEKNFDAMGHYGATPPPGICPKCNKPWSLATVAPHVSGVEEDDEDDIYDAVRKYRESHPATPSEQQVEEKSLTIQQGLDIWDAARRWDGNFGNGYIHNKADYFASIGYDIGELKK